MKHLKISLRYSKALFNLALENKILDEVFEDVCLVEKTCHQNRALVLLLRSPVVKTDQKMNIFGGVFDRNITKLTSSFLRIIIKKKREPIIFEIAKSFISLYKKHKNISTAIITTAKPLSVDLRSKIERYLKSDNKGTIELKEKVDEKIIGGVIITTGDKQLDASVSTEISEIRQMLNKNPLK